MVLSGEVQKTGKQKKLKNNKTYSNNLKIHEQFDFIGAFKGPCTLP